MLSMVIFGIRFPSVNLLRTKPALSEIISFLNFLSNSDVRPKLDDTYFLTLLACGQ